MVYKILNEILIAILITIIDFIINIETILLILDYYFKIIYIIIFQNEKFVKNNTYLFKYLKNPSLKITIHSCINYPENLKHIDNFDEFDKQLIYKNSIDKNNDYLKYIINQPLDIILYALINYPSYKTLGAIKNKTYFIYKIAVECGIHLCFIPNEYITKEICSLNNYRDLKFIFPEYYDLKIIKEQFKKNILIYNDLVNINLIELFDNIIEKSFDECIICNSVKKYFLIHKCNHPICLDCSFYQIKYKSIRCYYRCNSSILRSDVLFLNIND